MTARWLREHRADVQITACLLAGGSLLFGGGIGLGVHIAPVETVTVTRTITQAVPPVCATAINAAFITLDNWDAAEGHHQRAIELAEDQTEATYGRRQTELAQILEDSEKTRGLEAAAISARDGARQSLTENGPVCLTHQAPVVTTSQAVAR